MGTFTPNLRRTDLEALVRRVAEESSDLANRDVKVETDHIALQIDPALTEQIVETLLSNAGRRTVPGNAVWVKVSSDQSGAVIAVDDAGPEIPSGQRQTMFSAVPEDRSGAQKRAAGSTGLSLLSRLAEIHGGKCWVESVRAAAPPSACSSPTPRREGNRSPRRTSGRRPPSRTSVPRCRSAPSALRSWSAPASANGRSRSLGCFGSRSTTTN